MSADNQSPWSPYREIPIFLDTKSTTRFPRRQEAVEGSLRAPELSVPPHSVRYPRAVPPVVTAQPLLQVPSPHLDRGFTTNQPRTLPLRHLVKYEAWNNDSGTRIRLGHSEKHTVAQLSPVVTAKRTLGLGITDVPTSSATGSPITEDEEAVNIAQRIEKRFWRYNSSRNVIKRWLLEIVSWIISALCMGAILVLLAVFKDKAQPRRILGLTLNAYIAVLSRIASAALLVPTSEALGQLKWSWFQSGSKKLWDFEIFDNASRGPWGSFLLLVRTKGRALAALGATVMLLSLALDPFFQQVVDFPDRWLCDGKSFIPKITQYDPQYNIIDRAGVSILEPTEDLSATASQFFFGNGTQAVPFGNGTRADIPLSCPTSNCTWPQYQSLGVCSSCTDVSQLLTYACLTTKVDWIANLTGAGTEYLYPNGTVCGYFFNATSEVPVLMSGYNVDPVRSKAGAAAAGETLLMRAMPLVTNPRRETLFGGSINFRDVRNPIIDFVIASTSGASAVHRNETPMALECVLSWCVKTIESSYYWATYEEAILDNFINRTVGPFPWLVKPPNNSDDVFEVRYTENVTIHTEMEVNGPYYGLSNHTALDTITMFDDMFPSFTTIANSSSAPPLWRFKFINSLPILRTPSFNPWMPPNNVTSHVAGLANALTNAIRSSSSKEMVEGKAFSKETFVSVRWEWLTLPFGLLVATFIFLVMTIFKSSKELEHVGVRKTSAIATLVYGLPDDMRKKMTSSRSSTTPRAKAKELRVKLLPRTGWRVSGNLFTPVPPVSRTNDLPQNQPPPGWI